MITTLTPASRYQRDAVIPHRQDMIFENEDSPCLLKKKKMLYITEDFVVISYPNTFGFIFIELEVR